MRWYLEINELFWGNINLIAASQFSTRVCRTSGEDKRDEDSFCILAPDNVKSETSAAFDELDQSRFAREKPIFQPLARGRSIRQGLAPECRDRRPGGHVWRWQRPFATVHIHLHWDLPTNSKQYHQHTWYISTQHHKSCAKDLDFFSQKFFFRVVVVRQKHAWMHMRMGLAFFPLSHSLSLSLTFFRLILQLRSGVPVEVIVGLAMFHYIFWKWFIKFGIGSIDVIHQLK